VETGECQLHARTQSRPEKSTLDQLLDAAHTGLIKQKSYFYLHPFAMSTNPSSFHWSASGTAKERWLATHPELLDSLAPEVGSLPFQTELAPERAPLGEEHQHWTQSLASWITATEKSGDGCHAAEQALLLSQLAVALQRGETGVVLPDPSEATPLLGDADANRPLIVHPDSGLIQPRHLWQLEQQVAQQIRKRLAMQLTLPAPQKVESVLEQVLQRNPLCFGEQPLQLDSSQLRAVLQALISPLLTITGGPGTGKTAIVLTILRVLQRLGLAQSIALAAPTGRAARRLQESLESGLRSLGTPLPEVEQALATVGAQAQTLHRLLGYVPRQGRYRTHELNPLLHDVVVVDEASMIDLPLLAQLLRATHSRLPYQPSPARLILLGDAHQLPSVGAGAVLADLVSGQGGLSSGQQAALRKLVPAHHAAFSETATQSTPGSAVRLQQSYRQASGDSGGTQIRKLAAAVLALPASSTLADLLPVSANPNSLPDSGVARLAPEACPLTDFLAWWREELQNSFEFQENLNFNYHPDFPEDEQERLRQVFRHLNRRRILCVTQVLSTGAAAINQRILGHKPSISGAETPPGHWPAGTPVIVTKNLYEHQLYNGDQGVVLNFTHPENGNREPRLVFPVEAGYQTLYHHGLRHLQPAYAITVHKSQGSEYEGIALVLPERTEIEASGTSRVQQLLTREMIYTALTRARRQVIVQGELSVFENAVAQPTVRVTGLGFALQSHLASQPSGALV
jgi:exodeoxyribonuclease V alpha subunit